MSNNLFVNFLAKSAEFDCLESLEDDDKRSKRLEKYQLITDLSIKAPWLAVTASRDACKITENKGS